MLLNSIQGIHLCFGDVTWCQDGQNGRVSHSRSARPFVSCRTNKCVDPVFKNHLNHLIPHLCL